MERSTETRPKTISGYQGHTRVYTHTHKCIHKGLNVHI